MKGIRDGDVKVAVTESLVNSVIVTLKKIIGFVYRYVLCCKY